MVMANAKVASTKSFQSRHLNPAETKAFEPRQRIEVLRNSGSDLALAHGKGCRFVHDEKVEGRKVKIESRM